MKFICVNCGHPWSDHASGQMRANHFCEYPGCDCTHFRDGTDAAAEMMYRAWRADPAAIHALLVNRVPCNTLLAEDPTIVVNEDHLVPGSATVGAISLINGLLGEMGLDRIAIKWSAEADSEGRRRILGFMRYDP